MSMGKGHGV